VALGEWLDTVLAAAVLEPGTSWDALATASPVVGELARSLGIRLRDVPTPAELAMALTQIGELVSWQALRERVGELLEEGPDAHPLLHGLDPELLDWMDLGMFARHLLDERLPVGLVLDTLEALLPPPVFDRVTATIALTVGAGGLTTG
jgi:hypothetical protein